MQVTGAIHIRCVKLAAFGLLLGTGLTVHAQQLMDVFAQASQASQSPAGERHTKAQAPAAIWLTPLHPSKQSAPGTSQKFTLLQKNKQFTPHLLIVPVGSVVHFPNADPFFHNVFSLFDGRRFDLGLYEAGSSKEVTFGREGVSYIFCNIHPEMSAVVIALSTPFFSVEGPQGRFRIANVPADDYMLHIWVEGQDQGTQNVVARKIRISAGHTDLGVISLPQLPHAPSSHDNKYGQKYDPHESSIY